MSWFEWDTYLKQGKYKGATVERPMPRGGQTKRVVRMSDGSIGLKLHHTYCVRFYQDGTVAYDTGGWNTVTTRRFINDHGPVRVFSEKYDLRLNAKIGTTPPRVQKCRRCHGTGQVPDECYGPSYCYASYRRGDTCEHGETVNHRLETCSHGQAARHRLDDIDCWRCSASGKYDYGSRTIWFPWHGGYYRFNPDDPTVEVKESPVTYATAEETPSVHSGQSYSDSGRILAALMPDIHATVTPPCTCEGRTPGTVHDVIIHLNDTDKWTRERIADWLDTLDLNLRFPTPTT